jgi:hypothetical protein
MGSRATDMRVIGHVVTRNEMDRWLKSALPWLFEICDGNVAVYDDQSDDDIETYAGQLGVSFLRRPDGMPSFSDNEGHFRWAGWQAMERAFRPRRGDWILAVDADELLVTNQAGCGLDEVRLLLADAIGEAEERNQPSVSFEVAEVFAFDDMGWPLVRTDGYWGGITACRLAKWEPQGIFDPRKEGGGSLPSSWSRAINAHEHLELLHLGYARPEDRIAKHHRYRTGTGHNRRHVESILGRPDLSYWIGMRPPLKS